MTDNAFRIENRLNEFPDLPIAAEELQDFVEKNRRQIEPWLSAIFQSEHLALLIGSGFSTALSHAVNASPASMDMTSFLEPLDAKIIKAAKTSASKMGRASPNLEDQIRACVALLAGLEILEDAQAALLRKGLQRELVKFANSIVDMESEI